MSINVSNSIHDSSLYDTTSTRASMPSMHARSASGIRGRRLNALVRSRSLNSMRLRATPSVMSAVRMAIATSMSPAKLR